MRGNLLVQVGSKKSIHHRKGQIMALKIKDKEEFDKLITSKDKTVIIDFYAEWCGPCHMLSPVLEGIEEAHSDVTVGKVNVDENMELAREYGVVSIPMVLIYRQGELKDKVVGYHSAEEMEKLLQL